MYLLLNSGNICIISFYLQIIKNDSCNTVMEVLLHTSPYFKYKRLCSNNNPESKPSLIVVIKIYEESKQDIKFKGVIDCVMLLDCNELLPEPVTSQTQTFT